MLRTYDYVMKIGSTPEDPFPSGVASYEEREVQCQKQFGHPGGHWAMAEDKPLEWPDPYSSAGRK